MIAENRTYERRKHRRYPTKDGAFAVLRRPWPNPTTLGRIIDINVHGVAFSCVAPRERLRAWDDLEILWNDCSFRLRNLRARVVSDSRASSEDRFKSLEMRRLSMRFSNLTNSQISQLELFIENYSTDKVV